MRALLVICHRWAGLFAAVFLFISGLTGAIISWDHELDEWLNPHLFEASTGTTGPQFTSLALARNLEESDARLHVRYLPLSIEPGHTLVVSVGPSMDPATGKPHDLGFNQLALNPVTAEIQASRQCGSISLSRENLLPFLYKLHYTLHIPDDWGLEFGVLFMGFVAIVWTLDCIVALSISFPNRKAWRKSLRFRWAQGGYKLNFDLHRSGGVWLWGLLLILAVTSVSMNLSGPVVRPLVSLFSTLTPGVFDSRTPSDRTSPIAPVITREQAIGVAEAEALRRGWKAPAGSIFYAERYGLYGVTFFALGQDHPDGGLGNPSLYIDGKNGALVGERIPGTGSLGDIFLQAQFPLHSGRILGLPGRILVSAMGLIVAVLSVTGIFIWARKRRARTLANPNSYFSPASHIL